MDGRWGRRAAALTAGFICALGAAGTAGAFTPAAPDLTPPVVVPPVGTLDENSRTATLTASATDDRLGPLTYTWTAGDGTPPSTYSSAGPFLHVYPALGTYSGTVTVTDGAGNRATQTFTVAVVDHTAPRLGYTPVEPGVLATDNLRVVLAPTERVTAAITVTVRTAGRTYRLPVASRRLLPGRFTGVRIAVRREVREVIAWSLRRGLPVQARANIGLEDVAGNRGAAAAAAAITG